MRILVSRLIGDCQIVLIDLALGWHRSVVLGLWHFDEHVTWLIEGLTVVLFVDGGVTRYTLSRVDLIDHTRKIIWVFSLITVAFLSNLWVVGLLNQFAALGWYFQVKSFHCIVQVIWFVDLFFLSHEAFNTNRSLIWLSVFILVPKTTQLCAILALVTILTFALNLSIWGVVFEDLLSVTSNLSTDSGANILGHSLPVFAINFDC